MNLSQNVFASLDKSPKSTTAYNIHIFQKWTSRRNFLRDSTSHPSQPLFYDIHISKVEALAENLCETWQVTQVNQQLQHLYFQKSNLFLELVREIQQVNQVNHVWRHIYFKNQFFSDIFARNGESSKSTSKYDVYVLDRPPRKNSCHILASQPFQQLLQHIQFGKCSLQESNSSKSPKSTTYCDTHNFKNWISRRKFLRALTSHPSQPLITTYILSKNEPLAEISCETQQVTQVNHCLRHTYFQKLRLSQKIFSRPDKSPNSTSNCNTYIFKNQISFSIKLAKPPQVNQVNHVWRHIYFKNQFFPDVFARNGESP